MKRLKDILLRLLRIRRPRRVRPRWEQVDGDNWPVLDLDVFRVGWLEAGKNTPRRPK